jgi:hypothetical protein
MAVVALFLLNSREGFLPIQYLWWLFSCKIAVVAVILLEAAVALFLLNDHITFLPVNQQKRLYPY